jgi:hypothetical protein
MHELDDLIGLWRIKKSALKILLHKSFLFFFFTYKKKKFFKSEHRYISAKVKLEYWILGGGEEKREKQKEKARYLRLTHF